LDIGGTGIKGALVDVDHGRLTTERYRLVTPHPSRPDAVAVVARDVLAHFDYHGKLGVAFPAVIKNGAAMTAANIDDRWIGTDVGAVISDATGCAATPINDADAAGLAEVRFGAGRDVDGVVLMLTLGTGIGSAVFLDGRLVPNTELGHIELHGADAETTASDAVREREELSWKQWARRLSRYLRHVEALLWPDLIILGGGVSKKGEKFLPLLEDVRTPVVTAQLQNEAGIVGAAVHVTERPEPATLRRADR
jgi:polyphosphate glucokinase